jgi:hypothetical protein
MVVGDQNYLCQVTAHPIRHPERSEGSPESGSVLITEIPHCVRDDV